MRAVFVFLSIFLILVSSKTTKPEEPSHLHRIAGNFRILARVTNAIHIQSTIIKKSIKIRDLLSEFSHIPSNRLDVLLDMDIPTASLELNRIHKMLKKYYSKVKEDKAKQELHAHSNALKVLRSLDQKIEDLKKTLNIPLDDMFGAVNTTINSNMISGPCDKIDPKEIEQFLNLFPKYLNVSFIPDDKKVKEILDNTVKQKQNVLACIGAIKEAEYSALDEFIKVYERHTIWRNSIEFVFDFAMNMDQMKHLHEYVKFVGEQLDSSKSVWEQKNKSSTAAKSMEQLKNAVVFYRDYKKGFGYTHPDSLNLAGFPNADSMTNVFNDLKSAWFKKEVALNQSTKDLEQALKPYKIISLKIMNLTSTWRNVENVLNGAFYTPNMLNIVGRMNNITRFSENSSHFLNFLKNSKDALHKCVQPASMNIKKLAEYYWQIQCLDSVVISLKTLIPELKDLKDHFSYMTYPDRNRMFIYQKSLNITESFITTGNKSGAYARVTLSKIQADNKNKYDRIHEETMDESIDFLEMMKRIQLVADRMRWLKYRLRKIEKPVETVKELFNSVNVFAIHKCLKSSSFDASTLHFLMYVLNGIISKPDHQIIGQITQYLSKLKKVQEEYSVVERVLKDVMSKPLSSNQSKLILSMKESQMLSKHIGENTRFLENLEQNRLFRNVLLNVTEFPEDIQDFIKSQKLIDWANPLIYIKRMLAGADKVNEFAKNAKGQDLMNMADVFVEAGYVPGLAGTPEQLDKLRVSLKKSRLRGRQEVEKYLKEVNSNFDLDFASHRARLQNSRVVVLSLKKYFDDVFSKPKIEKQSDTYVTGHSWLTILSFCIGTIILLLTGAFFLYGWTENGRTKYINIWLYYFGKKDQFEKRWRYSLFLDYTFGRNQMHEAVREVNKINLKKVLKNGAYINAYNRFGNTALHVATKLAQPELVELLIKHGADRTLLNVQNQTPYQMIPLKFRDTDKAEDFEKVQLIYRKYKNKNFRLSVPQVFPESSFHVWVEDNVNADLFKKFSDKFPSIVSDETTTSTHCAVKTDENGVLHVEKIDHLCWIFNGTIIVKEQWLIDCLEDETLIMQDSKYLVEKVEYKGVIYDTVLKWSEAMAKGTMPFLQGVFVAIVMEKYDKLKEFSILVDYQGGMVMEQFPLRKYFNKGSHPYLHAHLPPLFLIHDGSIDLTRFKNDPDKMYTLFTEEEFLVFMLKREINRDVRERPIPVLKEREH